MLPIQLREIPPDIIDYIGVIKDIQFTRQGHTSDVGIISSMQGCYVIKRTKGEQYCSWLSHEIHALHCLHATKLPIPSVYKFVEEEDKEQSWSLMQFFEGETLRQALTKEKNTEKKHEMIFNFGVTLSNIHSTPCPEQLAGSSDWLVISQLIMY